MGILKNNKGITLAVLVFTIVVLLILAGITISNITGGDGILGQAQNKKDATTIQKEKTILGNAVMTASNKTKLEDLTEDNLRDALSNKNVDIVKSGGLYKITFKDTNNLYKMNENGEYFYWENMQPTKIYGKIENNILYLRATEENGYTKGTQWNNATITKIVIEDPIAPETCYQMFMNCSICKEIENIENLHTENVTTFTNMFYNCKALEKLNLKYFDTEKIESCSQTFYNCQSLTSLNLSYWNTSNIKHFYGMFQFCTNLTKIDLTNFDLQSAVNLGAMFNSCYSLTSLDLSSFDTKNVTGMGSMFTSSKNLKTIYVSDKFKINSNISSNNMFIYCSKLVGGAGTTYSSSHVDADYAHIDGGPTNPGYFTLKQ